MSIEDQPIGELEMRINVANFVLRWLRSDDPMLRDREYSPYVPKAIKHYEDLRNELMEVCRRRKIERDGDPNADPVAVSLKSAKMTGEARMN